MELFDELKNGKHRVTFGSDEELAMTKAIDFAFPDNERVLCSRHSRANITRQLTNAGIPVKVVNELIGSIFNKKSGLVTAKTETDFDKTSEKICRKKNITKVQTYLEGKLHKIKQYIWKPRTKGLVPLDWTNNNCESMNHVCKLKQKWESKRLPFL